MVQEGAEKLAWTVIAVAIALLLLLWVVRRNGSRQRKRLPPGPKPRPIVGNLGDVERMSHQGFAKMAKTYGPLIHLWLGSVHLVVANSAKSAKEILKTHDLNFASRPAITQAVELAYNCQTISFAHGPLWRNVRKMFTLELLTAKRIDQFQAMRTEETRTALRGILEQSNGENTVAVIVKIKEHMTNIMTRMLMSKTYFGPNAEGGRDAMSFQMSIKGQLELLGVFHLGDYIPMFKYWDVQGNKKKMREAHRMFDGFLQGVVDERRQQLETEKGNGVSDHDLRERGDFLDVLLTRSAEDDDVPITEAMMKGTLQDAIIGGVDSPSNTVEWALAELLSNPELLRKAQEELDSVVGRERLVEESDIPQLPYLHAIVKETFRLHPVTPLLVPRQSSEACEIEGFYIPAKSHVYVNVWAIGRDPEVWSDPLNFYPDRFLDSPIDVMGLNFELLPFGSGRRKCPGISLGVMVVSYFLAVLIQACQWSFPPGQTANDIGMAEGSGFVNHREHPVQVIITPRLPHHVIYSSAA